SLVLGRVPQTHRSRNARGRLMLSTRLCVALGVVSVVAEVVRADLLLVTGAVAGDLPCGGRHARRSRCSSPCPLLLAPWSSRACHIEPLSNWAVNSVHSESSYSNAA